MAINFNKVEFILSAASEKQFVRDGMPQLAFAGRSNVGKSSVINRLVNRKNFARVGASPGKTSQINYFKIDGKLYLVDLPGYGYAKVSKKQREKFGKMIENYLTTREQLRGVVQLVDGRHAPTEDDRMMFQWLAYYHIPTLVVATKVDKVKPNAHNRIVKVVKEGLGAAKDQDLILFSATTKKGVEAVWQWIEERTGVSD